jgi:UDP-glucose 4-epimerase
MSKKVFVTEVFGYIGLHCVKTLLEKGFNLTVLLLAIYQ